MPESMTPLIILGVVGALFILLLSLLTNNYSLNNIKSTMQKESIRRLSIKILSMPHKDSGSKKEQQTEARQVLHTVF